MVYESQVVGTESEHTQVGSVGPEDTFGNKDKSSSSLGMQEDKIGGSSNRSETETDDQTQCGGMAITNMSENSAQLSSSLVEEKADVLLEKEWEDLRINLVKDQAEVSGTGGIKDL
ncbi:hypothetical protein OIU76_014381 [Salix suchowensis]|nr:hypothetical protein OIU76_014381 [Salix suchowensis]